MVDEIQNLLNQLEDDTCPLPSEDEIKPPPTELVVTDPKSVAPQPPPGPDINQFFKRYESTINELVNCARDDRREAQDAIGLCRKQIDDKIGNNLPVQAFYVENYVKAIEVKAGINATIVKALDAGAKLLAATKAGVNITNNNLASANAGIGDSAELAELLNRPLDPEERNY